MPKDLMNNLREGTHAKTTTEALIIAASDWVYRDKLQSLSERIKKKPLRFKYTAEQIRELNRRKRW